MQYRIGQIASEYLAISRSSKYKLMTDDEIVCAIDEHITNFFCESFT